MADSSRQRRTQQTARLWERVAACEDDLHRDRLREEIVLLNISVAQAIARRYASRGITLEDLEQVACLGLVKAVRGFDPSRHKDFVSYAAPTVSGEVKRHFRDHGWTVRPPRRVQDLQARMNATISELSPTSGPSDRPAVIADRLGVDVAHVIEALTCRGAFTPMSLDAPLGEPGASDSLGDLLTSARDDYDHVENAMVLGRALRSLTERELLIVRRRFWDNRTQHEIAEEIGLSQMQVSRIIARVLISLRAQVSATDEVLSRTA